MRLNHVTLVVTDLERSKEFYRRLGLIQIVDSPPRYARFLMPDGDATLSVEVIEGAPANSASAQLFFECDDVDRVVSRLKEQGVRFVQEPTDMFYLWREARLRDPDGHDIRLYHENEGGVRLDPPWKIPGS